MRCFLDVSNSKYNNLGKIRGNTKAVIRPKISISNQFILKARLRVGTSLGRLNRSFAINQFSENFFGRSPEVDERRDGGLKVYGYLSTLKTKKYQVQAGESFIHVDTENSVKFLSDNPNIRTITVSNPEFKTLSLMSRVSGDSKIRSGIGLDNIGFKARISGPANVNLKLIPHKISGNYKNVKNFEATRSLYPIRDIQTSGFGDKFLQTDSLYSSIDEGVVAGDYNVNRGDTLLISDDDVSYIQATSKRVGIDYHLEFEVSAPTITPKQNFFIMRAAAPVRTRETDVTPIYKLKNIVFSDPSGNPISKYKDIEIVGDADFYADTVHNYTTYISEPYEDYAQLHTWDDDYPLFEEGSGYKISFDVSAQCVSAAFSKGFNTAYENKCKLEGIEAGSDDYLALDGSPLSTQYQDFEISPENSIRISSIEIACRANSNSVSGYIADNYVPFYLEAATTSTNLVQRFIYPTQVLPSGTEEQALPIINSVWRSSPDINGNISYNTSPSGTSVVTRRITDYNEFGHITLDCPVSESGKLSLKFEHKRPQFYIEPRGGSFNFGPRGGAFSRTELSLVEGFDGIFSVQEVELRIRAKKESSSVPDFHFDVMGWSDDKISYRTSKVKAFLQNESSQGGSILSSGYFDNDYLSLSHNPISNHDNYEETFYNPGGDHNVLSSGVTVNSTEFQTYIVPLKIYNNETIFGKTNYEFSNFFEHLYLDIYPLPSGASIARVELVVKHGPASALPLSVLGFNETKEIATRRYGLLPSINTVGQDCLNIYRPEQSISLISNIPQGFSSDETLKTNYSRRWKAVDGIYRESPFNSYEFDFSFEINQKDAPFSLGLYDFNNVDLSNNTIYSLDGLNSGVFTSSLSGSLIENIGLRFNSNSLFSHATPHTTIDWTEAGHELHGNIYDTFQNAIRVSGVDGHIIIDDTPLNSGFCLFLRISPDQNMSGVNYNLFNSGVIASKWDSGKDLEFAIAYNNGYLEGIAKDEFGNIVRITDSASYESYQYPLSVLLTYNDNESRKLKLYTDNELQSYNFQRLRATSHSFNIASGDSSICIGYCGGSGVGYNGFLTSLGISDYVQSGVNIVEKNPSRNLLQSTADNLLDTFHFPISSSVKQTNSDTLAYHSFVNNFADNWDLGEFKYCQFNYEFDIMSKRDGENTIVIKNLDLLMERIT